MFPKTIADFFIVLDSYIMKEWLLKKKVLSQLKTEKTIGEVLPLQLMDKQSTAAEK